MGLQKVQEKALKAFQFLCAPLWHSLLEEAEGKGLKRNCEDRHKVGAWNADLWFNKKNI